MKFQSKDRLKQTFVNSRQKRKEWDRYLTDGHLEQSVIKDKLGSTFELFSPKTTRHNVQLLILKSNY